MLELRLVLLYPPDWNNDYSTISSKHSNQEQLLTVDYSLQYDSDSLMKEVHSAVHCVTFSMCITALIHRHVIQI